MISSTASRRAFFQNGALVLLSSNLGAASLAAEGAEAASDTERADASPAAKPKRLLRAGLITDLHYADKEPRGTRHYRESTAKLAEAAQRFTDEAPDIVVELGDLIDAADSVEVELGYLERINRDFAQLPGDKHYVLGNHCVDTLTKEEFLAEVGQQRSYYSFDHGGVHCVVLDSCFRSDGVPYGRKNFEWTDPNVPQQELDWLQADLEKAAGRPIIVFAHQRLDVSDNHGVNNAAEVRAILEQSGTVQAVFQGHSHKNDHKEIAGIHYVTLVAMVEGSGEASSGYSTLDVFDDGSARLSGYRRQDAYDWG